MNVHHATIIKIIMLVDAVKATCGRGDESEAKSMVERDSGLHNQQDTDGETGLMRALLFTRHSLSRWLLSLPGLDTNISSKNNFTALHCACWSGAPLDIVMSLTRLSSWETVNRKDNWGRTALDLAVKRNNASAALHLSWLGAECKEENRSYSSEQLQ